MINDKIDILRRGERLRLIPPYGQNSLVDLMEDFSYSNYFE